MNPFQHGVTVTGKDFCPRPDLIAKLHEHIDSRQNCVVRGLRRMGKTSAVLEAIRSRKKTGYLYVNCWGKQDLHSLITAIYEAFLIYQQKKGLSLESVIRTFSHLRPKATIDPYSGEASFTVDIGNKSATRPQSLEAVIDLLADEGKRKSFVVVFDEFQTLLHFKDAPAVLGTLRGAIQLQSQTTFFYLGSTRNLMDDIFNNPNQPFFKSASSVTVDPIERSVYGAHIAQKFATGKRTIMPDALSAVFDVACDITGDVQQLCSELWNCTNPGDSIEPETISSALERIHHAENESNSRIIDLLTPGQIRVLVGLAKVGGKAPSSKGFLEAAGIAQPSSATKALRRLDDQGLIYRDANGYHFFSPFFRTWLLTQNL
jgi:hypothetical protein